MHVDPETESSLRPYFKVGIHECRKVVDTVEFECTTKNTICVPVRCLGGWLRAGVGEVVEDVVLNRDQVRVRRDGGSDEHTGRTRVYAAGVRLVRIVPVKRIVVYDEPSAGELCLTRNTRDRPDGVVGYGNRVVLVAQCLEVGVEAVREIVERNDATERIVERCQILRAKRDWPPAKMVLTELVAGDQEVGIGRANRSKSGAIGRNTEAGTIANRGVAPVASEDAVGNPGEVRPLHDNGTGVAFAKVDVGDRRPFDHAPGVQHPSGRARHVGAVFKHENIAEIICGVERFPAEPHIADCDIVRFDADRFVERGRNS